MTAALLSLAAVASLLAPAAAQGPLKEAVDDGVGTPGITKHYYGVTGFFIQVTDPGVDVVHQPDALGGGAAVLSISCSGGCSRSDAFVWTLGVPLDYDQEGGFIRAEMQSAVVAHVKECTDPDSGDVIENCVQADGSLAVHLALVWPCPPPLICDEAGLDGAARP